MPDPITAPFERKDWRIEVRHADRAPGLVDIMIVQEAWRRLTKASRAALLRLKTDAAAKVHPSTRAALIRHGLLDERGFVSAAGARVVVHRPVKSLPSHHGSRRVVDVHLPEGATA